jgi:hypothetical protein
VAAVADDLEGLVTSAPPFRGSITRSHLRAVPRWWKRTQVGMDRIGLELEMSVGRQRVLTSSVVSVAVLSVPFLTGPCKTV